MHKRDGGTVIGPMAQYPIGWAKPGPGAGRMARLPEPWAKPILPAHGGGEDGR